MSMKIWKLVIIFIFSVLALWPLSLLRAVGDVYFVLDPSQASKAVGENLDASLDLNAGSFNISAVDLTVNFDKDKLELLNFEPLPSVSHLDTVINEKNNLSGNFRYAGARSPSTNRASSQVRLGIIHFKAKNILGNAQVNFGSIQVTSSDQPTPLTIGNNQGGVYTITPAQAGSECPAEIRSTEAKLRVSEGETWSTEKTISAGQTVKVAGFHNGSISSYADDAVLSAIGPEGPSSHVESLTGNNVSFTPVLPGRYKIRATTRDKREESRCVGEAILTVTAAQVTTDKFRWAFDRSAFTDALPWQDYTEESKTQNIVFPTDMPSGVKQIWVEFKDSNGRVSRHNTPIKLLGAEPAVTGCSLEFEGSNVIFNVRGSNLGASRGTARSNETNLQIREWKDTNMKLVFPNAPVGQSFPLTLTNADGQTADGLCAGASTLSVGAKFFCRAPSQHDTEGVEMILAGTYQGGKKAKETVKIDRNGVIQNSTQKLEEGKKYKVSLKAPRSLRKTVEFTAASGATNLPNFTLPLGDIFPADGGDGSINAFDKTELNRQWVAGQATTSRSGDFNLDGRVNAIDWACMRQDFGKSDDEEPSAGGPAASPSSSPIATSSASPSPGT